METRRIKRKVLLLGDGAVGKTSLIRKFVLDKFDDKYITTIGVDYGVKKVNISGRKVAVNFFDLSGSQDYE